MTLTLKPPCPRCGGKGWYREPDPAGVGNLSACELCMPPVKPIQRDPDADAVVSTLIGVKAALVECMTREGVDVTEMARRLDSTPRAVARQMGDRDMYLGTVVMMARVLGMKLVVTLEAAE